MKEKRKPESKAEAAASFNRPKDITPAKELPCKYVETVYTYKDGSCRVREPRYTSSND